jgi:hypothetical protein
MTSEELQSSQHNDKESFLWDVHRYTNEYIRFADTKAAFVAGVDAALIGAAVSSSLYDSCLHQPLCHWSAVIWVAIVGITLLSVSIGFCVTTIIPRLGHNVVHGFIYWDSVLAHGSAKQFILAYDALGPETKRHEIANHIYVLASIAEKKYRFVRLAMQSGGVGWVLTAVAVWLQHALK